MTKEEFTPEDIKEMARMLDPANHVHSYCQDVLDGGVCSPNAITYGVAAGLAEFLRGIEQPQLIADAIKLLADELEHIVSEQSQSTDRAD